MMFNNNNKAVTVTLHVHWSVRGINSEHYSGTFLSIVSHYSLIYWIYTTCSIQHYSFIQSVFGCQYFKSNQRYTNQSSTLSVPVLTQSRMQDSM